LVLKREGKRDDVGMAYGRKAAVKWRLQFAKELSKSGFDFCFWVLHLAMLVWDPNANFCA
jgi:hypothetical protein